MQTLDVFARDMLSGRRPAWRFLAAAAAIVIGSTAGHDALATPYDTLQSIAGTYNVFLLGNLGTSSSPYASDSQGAVAVAGNAYLTNGPYGGAGGNPTALVVGGNLTQTAGSNTGNVYVGGNASLASAGTSGNLVVAGNLSQQAGSVSGNVFVGGATATLSNGPSINGSVNITGANATLTSGDGTAPGQGVYVTASATVHDPAYWSAPHIGGGPSTPVTPLDVFGSSTDLKNASTSLKSLAGATVASAGGAITITLTQSGLNVVNLALPDGATVNGINIVDANGVTATGIVLNVTGNNLNFNGGSYTSSALNNSQILYNFSNATNLTFAAMEFEGALLAPLATVNFSNGDIKGALIASNFVGNAQFNYAALNDPLPAYVASGGAVGGPVSTVPEPRTLALFGVGLSALILIRRRRKSAFSAAL